MSGRPAAADLNGKVAVIGGGAGHVGEGITRAFLRAGAHVVVPSRSSEKLAQLRVLLDGEALERFHGIASPELTTASGANAVAAQIQDRFQRLDAAVASLGGWWGGSRLVEMAPDAWASVLNDNLTSHFLFARAFIPLIEASGGGTYTVINGAAAYQPVPGSGVISIVAAAQVMLSRVLAEEAADKAVRVNQLMLASMIDTRARNWGDDPRFVTADEVGQTAAWLASDAARLFDNTTLTLNQKRLT